MTVVDSDILIDALRGREPSRTGVAEGLKAGTLATTALTAFELRSGVRTTKQEGEVELPLSRERRSRTS